MVLVLVNYNNCGQYTLMQQGVCLYSAESTEGAEQCLH